MTIQTTSSINAASNAVPVTPTARLAGSFSPHVEAKPDGSDSPSIKLDQVQKAIERLKQSIKPNLAQSLEFNIDQSSGRIVVKIIDAETRALVRQIPSEEILFIAHALSRLHGNGGLVSQQA